MPRHKAPLHDYPGEAVLLGKVQSCWIYGSADEVVRRQTMLAGAVKFLRKRPEQFDMDAPVTLLFLFGICFDLALHPDIVIDEKQKAGKRFLQFYAQYPDFSLAYLSELRRLASKTSLAARAAQALRIDGGNPALASIHDITKDSLDETRQALSRLDASMWQRKGKKSS